MSGQRTSARRLAILERSLSKRDLAILQTVRRLRLAGARQLEALHFAGHGSPLTQARACRRVLQRLTDHDLLIRLDRRVGGVRAGSAAYVYAIGHLGHRLLASGEPRRRRHEPSLAFVDHTLAVAEVVVALTTAERASAIEILDLQTEPDCWRNFTDGGAPGVLKPDLFVSLAVGEFELRWFFEVDLGSEHGPTIQRKASTYLRYLHSGREQREHEVFPRVLWATKDARRVAGLRANLDGLSAPAGLFGVCLLDEIVETSTEGGS